MKAYNLLLILLLTFAFLIALVTLFIKPSLYVPEPIWNSTLSNNCKLNNASNINSTSPIKNSTIFQNDTGNYTINSVDGDYIFNNISWSRYPNLEGVAIHNYEVTGPNTVINHTFVVFSIDVNIQNPDNTRELFYEMAGIVLEIRQTLGPNSSPDVWGLVNGVDSYNAVMLPYDNRIYVSDHFHPQAYKNNIYLIPGDDIYDYHNYTLINNSAIEP